MTARAGVEPTILRLKVIDSTKAPSRPTNRYFFVTVRAGALAQFFQK